MAGAGACPHGQMSNCVGSSQQVRPQLWPSGPRVERTHKERLTRALQRSPRLQMVPSLRRRPPVATRTWSGHSSPQALMSVTHWRWVLAPGQRAGASPAPVQQSHRFSCCLEGATPDASRRARLDPTPPWHLRARRRAASAPATWRCGVATCRRSSRWWSAGSTSTRTRWTGAARAIRRF